jgi:hypothetical protein
MEVECVSLSLELAWNGLSTDELILLLVVSSLYLGASVYSKLGEVAESPVGVRGVIGRP